MAKPIEYFKSEEQFKKCCKDWQHKLFLDDWFIKFELTEEEMQLDDNILDGMCEFNFNNKEAKIKIFNGKYESDDVIMKQVGELTLIHELLHIKLEYLSDVDIIGKESETFHKYIFHQSIETMAKSLLMAKYNLDYDYFMGD